jgi:hypothetical protein
MAQNVVIYLDLADWAEDNKKNKIIPTKHIQKEIYKSIQECLLYVIIYSCLPCDELLPYCYCLSVRIFSFFFPIFVLIVQSLLQVLHSY